MPSTADFTRLEESSLLALKDRWASSYAPWMAAKGAGLKARAKTELDGFLTTASRWSEDEKRGFIGWLDGARDRFDDKRVIAPHAVMTRLVLPTLKAWIVSDPQAPEPHLLLGRFHDWKLDPEPPESHFRAALQRQPSLLAAKRGLALALLAVVEDNQHHLPDYYIGDRAADVSAMAEVAYLSEGMPDLNEAATLRMRAELLARYATGDAASGGSARYYFPRRESGRSS